MLNLLTVRKYHPEYSYAVIGKLIFIDSWIDRKIDRQIDRWTNYANHGCN